MVNRKDFDWGDETFVDPDHVVAKRWKRKVAQVSRERKSRGISHMVRDPVIDWGGETFEEHDEVVALRHGTIPAVVGRERRRRGIQRIKGGGAAFHLPRPNLLLDALASGAPRVPPPALGQSFVVKVRGVEVICASVDAVDALVRRYGEGSGAGAQAPELPAVAVAERTSACVGAAPVCYPPAAPAAYPASAYPPVRLTLVPQRVAFERNLVGGGKLRHESKNPPRPPQIDDDDGDLETSSRPPVARPPEVPLAGGADLVGSPADVSVSISDVAPASVEWLWRDRIPLGMVTVVFAPPGVGKGTLTVAVAAAVTRGVALPEDDRPRAPRRVLFVGAEDDLRTTLRPRLEAAEADLALVSAISPEKNLKLPRDAALVEAAKRGAALVVVDPLRAFVNGDSPMKVREALTALEVLARRTGAAVVVAHHTNRSKAGTPLERLLGSTDIIGIPRSLLFVGEDGEDPSVRVLSQVKANLAPSVTPVRFRVVSHGVGTARVGRVEWVGPGSDIEGEEGGSPVVVELAAEPEPEPLVIVDVEEAIAAPQPDAEPRDESAALFARMEAEEDAEDARDADDTWRPGDRVEDPEDEVVTDFDPAKISACLSPESVRRLMALRERRVAGYLAVVESVAPPPPRADETPDLLVLIDDPPDDVDEPPDDVDEPPDDVDEPPAAVDDPPDDVDDPPDDVDEPPDDVDEPETSWSSAPAVVYDKDFEIEDVSALPLHKRQIVWARAAKLGHKRASELLVGSIDKWIWKKVKAFQRRNFRRVSEADCEDVVAEVRMTILWYVIPKFDADAGYNFLTYADHWVKFGISRWNSDQSRVVRVPTHVIESTSTFLRAIDGLTSKLSRSPTDEEVVAESGLTMNTVRALRTSNATAVSFDAPGVGDEGDAPSLLERYADPSARSVEDRLCAESSVEKAALRAALAAMSPRQRRVMEMRLYGNGGAGMTLQEVGDAHDLTCERIRQIEKIAMSKIERLVRRSRG